MNEMDNNILYTLHEAALLTMVTIYVLRLVWLHRRFRAAADRQPQTGHPGTGPVKGAIYSLGILTMPWHLESTRRHPILYLQFVAFHLGAAAAIFLSFLLPYAPEAVRALPVNWGLGILIGMGLAAATMRLYRRVLSVSLRAMNTFGDYLSLSLLTVWLALAFLSLPALELDHRFIIAFYWLTAFFLFYVPFSKISHYLYFPIGRYWFGRTMGHRGVYPLVHVPLYRNEKH